MYGLLDSVEAGWARRHVLHHETGVVLPPRVCRAGAKKIFEIVFSLVDSIDFCTSDPLGDIPVRLVWFVRGEITGSRIQSMSMSRIMIKMSGIICILAEESLPT